MKIYIHVCIICKPKCNTFRFQPTIIAAIRWQDLGNFLHVSQPGKIRRSLQTVRSGWQMWKSSAAMPYTTLLELPVAHGFVNFLSRMAQIGDECHRHQSVTWQYPWFDLFCAWLLVNDLFKEKNYQEKIIHGHNSATPNLTIGHDECWSGVSFKFGARPKKWYAKKVLTHTTLAIKFPDCSTMY